MKVALLSTIYPFRGGIAQFNGALFRAFEKKNETKAFTFSRQYPQFLYPGENQYVTPNDVVDAIPSEAVLDSINPFSYLSAARKINAYAPDLMVMKFWLPFLGPALGTVANRVKKNSTVVTIVDNAIPHEKRFMDDAFSNYFFNQNHGFVALSEAVKNDLYSLKPEIPCIVLPHPLYDHFGQKIDKQEAIRKLGLPADKKLLLYFGYIRDYKGLDLLIEAISKLDDSHHLILAGESYSSFDKYTQLIEQFGVKDKITVINRYIPDHEVTQLFSAADVCVLSYKSATQSGVTAIALHFEIPLIVTNVGGLNELVFHEKTGLLIQEPRVDLIVEQVHNFFNNHMQTDFGSNIRQLKEELSWDRFAEKLIDFSKGLKR